jgi:hypothetical protein
MHFIFAPLAKAAFRNRNSLTGAEVVPWARFSKLLGFFQQNDRRSLFSAIGSKAAKELI